MMNKIYVLFSIFLLTSCSSLENKTDVNYIGIEKELVSKLTLIQNELKNNQTESLKESLDVSFAQKYAINRLSEYDLSKINFKFSNPNVVQGDASNILVMQFGEIISYFDVEYKYLNEEWKITEFKERR